MQGLEKIFPFFCAVAVPGLLDWEEINLQVRSSKVKEPGRNKLVLDTRMYRETTGAAGATFYLAFQTRFN